MKKLTLPAVPLVAAVCVTALLSATGGAVAGSLITGADVRNESLTGDDIRDGSVAPQDLSKQTEKSVRRVGGYQVVGETQEVDATSTASLPAYCPRGTRVLGGAGFWKVSNAAVQTVFNPDGRSAIAFTDGIPTSDELSLRIICGRVA